MMPAMKRDTVNRACGHAEMVWFFYSPEKSQGFVAEELTTQRRKHEQDICAACYHERHARLVASSRELR